MPTRKRNGGGKRPRRQTAVAAAAETPPAGDSDEKGEDSSSDVKTLAPSGDEADDSADEEIETQGVKAARRKAAKGKDGAAGKDAKDRIRKAARDGAASADDEGGGGVVCVECGDPLLPSQPRYRTMRAHKKCGLDSKKALYHCNIDCRELGEELKKMRKTDPATYREIIRDVSMQKGHISKNTKAKILSKVKKSATKTKKLTKKQGLKYCDREQTAGFLHQTRLWAKEKSEAWYDKENRKRKKGTSELEWRKHPRSNEWTVGLEKAMELDHEYSVQKKKTIKGKSSHGSRGAAALGISKASEKRLDCNSGLLKLKNKAASESDSDDQGTEPSSDSGSSDSGEDDSSKSGSGSGSDERGSSSGDESSSSGSQGPDTRKEKDGRGNRGGSGGKNLDATPNPSPRCIVQM